MPATPPVLYKYLPPERIDVLAGLRIRFSQPSALNDPYECTLTFSLDDIRQSMQSEITAALGVGHPIHQRLVGLLPAVVRQERLEQIMAGGLPTDNVQRALDTKLGVLSLSMSPINTRMWSLYAADHRGFCLGFHRDAELCAPSRQHHLLQWLYHVEYADTPHALPLKGSIAPEDLARLALTRKSHDWSDEQEVRAVRSLEHGRIDPFGTDSAGHPLFLYPFPKTALAEVVLGARCSADTETRIREHIANHDVAVRVQRIEKVAGTFRLRLVAAG